MKIWILSWGANDYNQHGEYFIAAFKEKPSPERLFDVLLEEDFYVAKVEELHRNGETADIDNNCFCLTEEELK